MDKELIRILEKGREHYDNREYDKAEAYLLQVTQQCTGYADVMNMLGVIYHDRGQAARAQEFFEKAYEINPRYTEAALNLAVVYNEQERYAEAKKIFEGVIATQTGNRREIEPFARGKLANMHAQLGRAYAELQIWEQAIAQFRQALTLCPEFVDLRTRLGQILRDTGDYTSACMELQRVKTERPTYVPARVSLGVTYFTLGDRELAEKEWLAAQEMDPQNQTAKLYLNMVRQLLAQEEAEAAGMHMEIELKDDVVHGASEDSSELVFTFDGNRSGVTAVADPSDKSPGPR